MVCAMLMISTMRHKRYAYTSNSVEQIGGCHPLLSLLVCLSNPHKHTHYELRELVLVVDNDLVTTVQP
jgi:hypothetical protein